MRKLLAIALIVPLVGVGAFFLYQFLNRPAADSPAENAATPGGSVSGHEVSAVGPPFPAPTNIPPGSEAPKITPVDPSAIPPRPAPLVPDAPGQLPRKQYPVPKDDPRVTRNKDGSTILNIPFEVANELHEPDSTLDDDVQKLDYILENYRLVFGANPVGLNLEVMAELLGNNSRKIIFFPPDHPSLGPSGELLDRYGNPYFFHSISEKVMDVVSPGGDGIIGTSDDVHSNPNAGETLQLNADADTD